MLQKVILLACTKARRLGLALCSKSNLLDCSPSPLVLLLSLSQSPKITLLSLAPPPLGTSGYKNRRCSQSTAFCPSCQSSQTPPSCAGSHCYSPISLTLDHRYRFAPRLSIGSPQTLTFQHNPPARMSSSGQGGSGGPEHKPRGLAKFMRRASLVLKRDKSKRQSMSNPSGLAPISDSVVPTQSSSTPAPR